MTGQVQSVTSAPEIARKPRRLYRWFLAGFLTAFILIAIFMTETIPVRDGIARTPLWNYYARTIPKLLQPQPLAPVRVSSGAVLTTIVEHLIASSVCGLFVMAIGWATQRRL